MVKSYVALGDSLTQGISDWGRGQANIGFADVLANLLRANEPGLRYTNLGVGGARVADVLRSQLPQVAALAPDLVTLAVGANDIQGTALGLFAQDYGQLLGGLRANQRSTIVVATVPNFAHLLPPQFATYREAVQERVRAFNRIIVETAAAHEALVVDLQDRPEVQDPRNVSADGVHPNARGYRIMAHAFAETLNSAGFALSLPTI
ncbi:MAG: SGNH/GDSL hydrolase family protein [Chloroflexota bacterium]|nr:SGNH/GDSL hydrolase family protein [Chloroflexota bacterium]